MNIRTLCDNISLQPEIKKLVLSFADSFDFGKIDELQKGYFTYSKMSEALAETQAILGEDTNGVKVLSCILRAAAKAYDIYRDKGISDEIYFATMKCFPRFINEALKITGRLCFTHYYWSVRQAGCHLYRLGELEYEIKPLENETVIDIHIPSDSNFSPSAVDKSIYDAFCFFEKYYPLLKDTEYYCRSWLLDGQLREMLGGKSNILQFQNRFEIVDKGDTDTDFMKYIFHSKLTDYTSLPENTSLQRNVKKHLLSGGVIRSSYGRLIKEN